MATSTGISSPSDSLIVTSPTLSASSLSSSGLDFVDVGRRFSHPRDSRNTNTTSITTPVRNAPNLQTGEESSFSDDDEIVWTVSESEDVEGFTSRLGDDDFVILGRTGLPPLRSHVRTRTSGSAATQASTMRGILLGSKLEHQYSAEKTDRDGPVTLEGINPANEPVVSELEKALATLKVSADSPIGEVGGKKTLVDGETYNSDFLGALPRYQFLPQSSSEDKKKKERNKLAKRIAKAQKEDKAAAKKEEKKQVKEEAGKVAKSKKEKKSKRKASSETLIATPVANPALLPPSAPELAKSLSTATLVPSPSIPADSITPQPPSPFDVAVSKAEDTPTVNPNSLPSPSKTVRHSAVVTPDPLKKKKKGKKGKTIETGHSPTFGQANTVDAEKVTEQTSSKLAPTAYDEAVGYITSYISNIPAHHDRICHLTLLQSLIIELGLITNPALLPCSIKSAKKFIKTRVFLNIKEYLKMRHQGHEVVQGLLFPSRSALVKDMKQKKNFASLQWVKKQGLQDLLVGIFRH